MVPMDERTFQKHTYPEFARFRYLMPIGPIPFAINQLYDAGVGANPKAQNAELALPQGSKGLGYLDINLLLLEVEPCHFHAWQPCANSDSLFELTVEFPVLAEAEIHPDST